MTAAAFVTGGVLAVGEPSRFAESIISPFLSSLPFPLVSGNHGSSQDDLSAPKAALLVLLLGTSPVHF